MHSWQTLAPAASGHSPASASLAGKKSCSLAGPPTGNSPSMLEVFYALWGLTEAKCPFPIHYTNLGSQAGINSDSSRGQHRKVKGSVDTGHSYRAPVSSTLSAFKVCPEFRSAPSLYIASILKVPSV